MKSKTKVSLYAALFLVLSPVYAGEAADAERLLGTWMDWTERRQQIGTNYYAYSREESDKIWARLREEESKIFPAMAREYAALGDGLVTPFAKLVLTDSNRVRLSSVFLARTIASLDSEQQRTAASAIFNLIPEP